MLPNLARQLGRRIETIKKALEKLGRNITGQDATQQAKRDALEAELKQLQPLATAPDLCPPEKAQHLSPVQEVAPPAVPPVAAKPKKAQAPQVRRRRFVPRTRLENYCKQMKPWRRVLPAAELEARLLDAYDLQTLGELASVLRREYGVSSAGELIDTLFQALDPLSHKMEIRAFLFNLAEAITEPPGIADTPEPRPWVTRNRFEARLLAIGKREGFKHWRKVGRYLQRVYAATDERDLARRVLGEYGLSWPQVNRLRARLAELSQQLSEETNDPRDRVRAWLFYFHRRLCVLAENPTPPSLEDVPYHRAFNGDFSFSPTFGNTVTEQDWKEGAYVAPQSEGVLDWVGQRLRPRARHLRAWRPRFLQNFHRKDKDAPFSASASHLSKPNRKDKYIAACRRLLQTPGPLSKSQAHQMKHLAEQIEAISARERDRGNTLFSTDDPRNTLPATRMRQPAEARSWVERMQRIFGLNRFSRWRRPDND